MRACVAVVFTFLVVLFLLPASASAQAEIAGVVRDTSGAVLPGVTVEAASPALIERVRSVVTNGSGQYRIVNLRPGDYTVTFSLTGFNTIKREGVVLAGSAVVQVNADLRVGALEETITVTGEAPVVDVQTVTRQSVIDKEIADILPTARRYYSLGVLLPGVSSNSNDVGGAVGNTMSSLTAHGSSGGDQRILQNGVNTSGMSGGGAISGVVNNMGAAQEMTIDTTAVSADLGQGGVRINFVPRDGGNTYSGAIFATFSNAGLQGDNFTQRLKDRGLRAPDSIDKNWDFSPAFGGPIQRDRLWFWSSGMLMQADQRVADMFHNRNAWNPNAWTYEPDTSRPAVNHGEWWNAQTRVTWQAAPQHKIAGTYDQHGNCRCPSGVTATRAPEAAPDFRFPQQRIMTLEWTSPLTNRVLVEAVGLHRTTRWGNMFPASRSGTLESAADIAAQPSMIAVQEQSTGLWYRARDRYNNNWNNNYFFRGSLSYITGSHAFKVGFNDTFGFLQDRIDSFQPFNYRFNNGVPNRLTMLAVPWDFRAEIDRDFGLYAQERWTVNRLTLSGAVRFDSFKNSFPERRLGPGQLVPTRDLTFPEQDSINWTDLTYRSGASYDLFGTGRTAVKASLNRFIAGQTLNGLGQDPHPVNSLVTQVDRSWTDRDRDFAPDCNLLDPLANGECGAMSNRNFGTSIPGATFDPDLLTGFGNRNYNWEFSTSVEHQLAPRVSVDIGYFRRWFGNFRVTDNVLLEASDFDTFSIVAPGDPRLPGGGGQTISGLFNVKPGAFGREQQLNSLSDKYGTQTEHWNGVDVTGRVRLQNGLTVQGGVSTGRRSEDSCDVRRTLPETALTNPYCQTQEAFLTQVKMFGFYTVPRIDVQVSGTFQSTPGPAIAANFNANNAAVLPSLGRPLAGGASNVTVNLIEPGTLYGERLNQLDFRVGKIIRVGGTRTTLNLDLYNALNADTITGQNNTFGPAWQRPTSILLARFAKVSATFDF